MVLLHHSEEGLEQPYRNLVGTLVVVAVAWEVALGLELQRESGLVAEDVDFGILDGTDGVDHMTEPGDSGGEGTAHVSIDEGHLDRLIEILVVHIVNDVQRLDVDAGEPVHHVHEAGHELVVGQHVTLYRAVLRAALLAGQGVHTAGDGVGETLGEVGACPEELHLLARLRGTDTAADAVVVAPHRTHHVVVLVLYGTGLDGNHGRVLLEVHRQARAVEHGEVRLR